MDSSVSTHRTDGLCVIYDGINNDIMIYYKMEISG
jgi:hypothetical protein